MYTRGRKKAEAKPGPPARDPCDVEMIERLQQRIQELEIRQLQQDSPTEEAESESKIWDDGPGDVNPFGGIKHRYRDRRYHLRRTDRAVDRDDRYHDDLIRSMGLKIEIPNETRAIKLRQHASLWWDHVTKRRRMEGKSKVETWEKMKKLIKAKFLPENHRQEAFLDYHNLSQRNMTVEEVINKFDKLRMRCDVVEEDEQVVARFLGVLKPEIADIDDRVGGTVILYQESLVGKKEPSSMDTAEQKTLTLIDKGGGGFGTLTAQQCGTAGGRHPGLDGQQRLRAAGGWPGRVGEGRGLTQTRATGHVTGKSIRFGPYNRYAAPGERGQRANKAQAQHMAIQPRQ
ncbi:reverse transcriptase domain-containing protein [Tanacetum coccineum]